MIRRSALAASICVAVLLVAGHAEASPAAPGGEAELSRADTNRSRRPDKPRRISVPELDPTAAGAIVAIIAGGALLVARRRRRE